MELSPQSALAELRRRNRAENRRKRAIAAALADGKPAPLKRVRLSQREQAAALAAIAASDERLAATMTGEPPTPLLLLVDKESASTSAPAMEKLARWRRRGRSHACLRSELS